MRPSLILATFVTSVTAAWSVVARAGGNRQSRPRPGDDRPIESEGSRVNVDRVGSGRIDDCVVTSVRNPQTQTRNIRVYRGRDGNGNRSTTTSRS